MPFTNQTVSIQETFEYFYIVPEYQRGYVWDEDKVTEFTTTLIEEFVAQSEKGLFIGAAVFEETGDIGRYFVVDGQQRLTSIFIIVCAAYNLLKEAGHSPQILTSIEEEFLRKFNRRSKKHNLKIIHTDEKSHEAMINIIDDKSETPNDANLSAQKIYEAYRAVKSKLSKELRVNQLDELTNHFSSVNILPFISSSRDESLTVFETLNSKGVGLTSLDILKSLLFDAVNNNEDSDDWDNLNQKWNYFIDLFDALNMPSNKFLRYVIYTQYDDSVKAAECLNWFRKNKQLDEKDQAFEVLKTLTFTAEAIKKIRLGKGPDGKKNQYLENIRSLAPSAEQQYYLLLSNWTSSASLFNQIALVAEAQIFVNKILAHYTGATEKNFIEWGKSIKFMNSNSVEINAYIEENIWTHLRADVSKLEDKLSGISLSNTAKPVIRWILKRCEIYALQMTGVDISGGVNIIEGVDIEHIEPDSSTRFGQDRIQLLGNLTLHEKGFNRANGKLPFEEKQNYEFSKIHMTRSLRGIPEIGGSNRAAYEIFYSAENWGPPQILERTTRLTNVILKALKIIV